MEVPIRMLNLLGSCVDDTAHGFFQWAVKLMSYAYLRQI